VGLVADDNNLADVTPFDIGNEADLSAQIRLRMWQSCQTFAASSLILRGLEL
jgi:hypothetical protein